MKWAVGLVLLVIIWLAAAGVLAPVVITGALCVLYLACGRIF